MKNKKVLLHTCCAPCLIYPLKRLRQDGFEVAAYYYNPNIHPPEEFVNRKKAVESLSKLYSLEVIYEPYQPSEFFRAVNFKETDPGRCAVCWEMRFKKTALAAREGGFGYFSTTLLVSPYQDQSLLAGIGSHIEEEENVDFYFEDFRPGFREAHNEARSKGIYCQKYCGCIYSQLERCKKSGKP